MGFDRSSIIVDSSDGRNFHHVSGFSFTRKNGETVVVSPGESGDGASSPPTTWSLFPPFGWYWMATLLHDHAYRNMGKPKEWCDALFLEAMESLIAAMPSSGFQDIVKKDARRIEARTLYEAVALCGRESFTKDRKSKGGIS